MKKILVISDAKNTHQYNEWLGLSCNLNTDIVISFNDVVPPYSASAETFCSRLDTFKCIDYVSIYNEDQWLDLAEDFEVEGFPIVITSKTINDAVNSNITSTHQPAVVVCNSISNNHQASSGVTNFICNTTANNTHSLSYTSILVDKIYDSYNIHIAPSHAWLHRYYNNQKPI